MSPQPVFLLVGMDDEFVMLVTATGGTKAEHQTVGAGVVRHLAAVGLNPIVAGQNQVRCDPVTP